MIVKQILIIILILIAKLSWGQLHPADNFIGYWKHSYEEDKGNYQYYRPSDYSFPISRGRESFQIMENGTFIYYKIGANDTYDKIDARWCKKGKRKLIITSNNTKILTIILLESNESFLKIIKK